MQFLYNSKGQHIANSINQQLYAPEGQNIGHYVEKEAIFVDSKGRYLGEIVQRNRFLFNGLSPFQHSSYGIYTHHGNVGHYGYPGNHGNIGLIAGYQDIATPWIKQKK